MTARIRDKVKGREVAAVAGGRIDLDGRVVEELGETQSN